MIEQSTSNFMPVIEQMNLEEAGTAELRATTEGLQVYFTLTPETITELFAQWGEGVTVPLAITLVDSVDTIHIGRQEFAFRLIPTYPTIQIRGTEASE